MMWMGRTEACSCVSRQCDSTQTHALLAVVFNSLIYVTFDAVFINNLTLTEGEQNGRSLGSALKGDHEMIDSEGI
jgi:hypothetical protein